jgi:hypothetical protein
MKVTMKDELNKGLNTILMPLHRTIIVYFTEFLIYVKITLFIKNRGMLKRLVKLPGGVDL